MRESSQVGTVELRGVVEGDLSTFFEHQLDPVAIHMAAFTAANPADRDAFTAHWARILADESVIKRTVLIGGQVAGHVVSFERSGDREVSYWIGREFWGQGLATEALTSFLGEISTRPLYARAARDNLASIRVLEKCGFKVIAFETAHANARGREIEEAILKLD